jgi:glutamine synthetase
LQNQLVDTKKTVQELLHNVSEQGATIERLHREASQAQYEVCECIILFA